MYFSTTSITWGNNGIADLISVFFLLKIIHLFPFIPVVLSLPFSFAMSEKDITVMLRKGGVTIPVIYTLYFANILQEKRVYELLHS